MCVLKTTKDDRSLRSNLSSMELPTNRPRRQNSLLYSKLHQTRSFPRCTCASRSSRCSIRAALLMRVSRESKKARIELGREVLAALFRGKCRLETSGPSWEQL